ncbi:hypothetical protein [Enterococcus sp. DIV0187]|uniref:hypothetical protein n=1 Tax=Enterococcus sp. DIV0187 TaxID=2774644 RepID=UPI003F26E9BC
MNEERYTVLEIAEAALKKYKVSKTEGTLEALKKQIRRIIQKENYQPEKESKKSEYSKRPAQAYSLQVKNMLVDDLLFDYMLELVQEPFIKEIENSSNYRLAKKSNDRIENEYDKFLNSSSEEKDAMIGNQENLEFFNENSSFIREKKMEIMLEALFSKYYTLKMDELIEDANKINSLINYNQNFFGRVELREISRFNSWQNYVSENEK